MKLVSILSLTLLMSTTALFAQTPVKSAVAAEAPAVANGPVITFEKESHNFGAFSEENPELTYVFNFKNTGSASLVIHQVQTSCGCTAPSYSKEPIKPGASGKITVKYNGQGKALGHFRKSITVRSNADEESVRLFIEGDMKAKK